MPSRRVVTKLLFGIVGVDEAIAHGLRLDGDRSALDRLRPRAAA